MVRVDYLFASGACSIALLFGCSSSNSTDKAAPAATTATESVDFVAESPDFDCILGWTKVREFYIKNQSGKMSDALAVANSANGGKYPVGTIIQLIPQEAMVKRKAGFSAETMDWEFFSLNPAPGGTIILSRGTTDVLNQFNLNCLDCHKKADPKFDMLCETTHGCDPLPINAATIQTIQQGDPRCHDQ
jgi:hypothetical protein